MDPTGVITTAARDHTGIARIGDIGCDEKYRDALRGNSKVGIFHGLPFLLSRPDVNALPLKSGQLEVRRQSILRTGASPTVGRRLDVLRRAIGWLSLPIGEPVEFAQNPAACTLFTGRSTGYGRSDPQSSARIESGEWHGQSSSRDSTLMRSDCFELVNHSLTLRKLALTRSDCGVWVFPWRLSGYERRECLTRQGRLPNRRDQSRPVRIGQ
jgi:hypothetical protein